MQVCTSLQTDNHASTPPLSFLQAGCPSCRPTNSVKALKAKEYTKTRENAKRVISSAKEEKHKEYTNDLNDSCKNKIFRMARQVVKERQDITGSNCIKGASGKVTVDEKGIKVAEGVHRVSDERRESMGS